MKYFLSIFFFMVVWLCFAFVAENYIWQGNNFVVWIMLYGFIAGMVGSIPLNVVRMMK